MKITGYSSQVNTVSGASNANTVNYSAVAKAATSDVLDMSPVAKGLGDWAKTIDAIHEQEDRQNVLAAMDDYNKQMSELLNGKNGYLNRELQGANGIVEDYAEKEKQIRQSTIGNTKLFFKGNKMGLEHSLAGSAQQGFDRVLKWQQKQMDAVSDLHLENVVADNTAIAQASYNDPFVVKNSQINIMNALSLRHGSKGADYMDAAARKTLGNYGASLMDAAMAHNDINGATGIFQEYKQFMAPEQRNKFEQKSVNLQLGEQQRSLFDEWIKGNVSPEEAFKRIDAMDGYTVKNINAKNIPEQPEGTTWEKMNANVSLEGLHANTRRGLDVAAKIYSDMFPGEKLLLTSGMDGTHETHKGESIDVNDNWGKTILANKANRDKFKAALSAQGIRVLDEYENKTKYQTGPHLHLEFNDFNPGSGTRKIPLSLKDKQDWKNMYLASYNQQKNLRNLHETEVYNSIAEEAAKMAKNKIPLTDAMRKLVYDKTGKDFIKAKSAVSAVYSGLGLNGSGEYGKGSHPVMVSGIKDMIAAGKFDSKADAIDYAKSKKLSEADVNKVWVAWDQNLKGEGEFKYNWNDIKQRVMDGTKLNNAVGEQAWAEARAYGADWLKQYVKEHNGEMPSEAELIDACKQGKLKQFSFNYSKPDAIFDSKFEYSKGAMSAAKIVDVQDDPNDKSKSFVYYKGNNGRLIVKTENKVDVVNKLGGKQ